MADEEKNEPKQDDAPEEQPQAEAPEEEAPASDDAPAEEAPAEAEEEAAAEEAEEEAPAEEGAPAGEAPEGEGAPDELEGLGWKARRRLERSRRPAEPGPQGSPDERASQRTERRRIASRRRSSYRRKQRQKRERGEGTPPAERHSVARKTRQGRVVSSKPDKTITVRIDIVRRHSSYEKIVRQSGTLHAHDEQNEANEGDLVRVVETRPLSRTKRWRLVEILEKAK
jgi:small subunit ribosomal protein S17